MAGNLTGLNGRALKAWIAQHMPELERELGPMTLNQVRVRLNELTGLSIDSTDSIERSCDVFLGALKAQNGAWRTEA